MQGPVFYEVVGGVHVGAGVGAEVQAEDVHAVSFYGGRGLEAGYRVAGEGLGAFVYPVGEVYDAAYLHRRKPLVGAGER